MSAEVLIADDALAVLVPYLGANLSEPVSHKVPRPRPDSFVTLTVTGGGGRRDLVMHEYTVSVDCWAQTDKAASDLARAVEAYMLAAWQNLDAVYDSASFGTPADFPDPDSGQPRFRGTFQVTLRASAP